MEVRPLLLLPLLLLVLATVRTLQVATAVAMVWCTLCRVLVSTLRRPCLGRRAWLGRPPSEGLSAPLPALLWVVVVAEGV
jgi:hypothetical protein